MLHFFHNFKISCKGNKKHSNNQIKIERYDAHFNLMFIIHTCDVFNRLNSILPHALKGQKLLAQGIRPGYSCPHAWRPERAKALYGASNMINKPKKNRRKDDVNGFFFVLLYAIKEMQDLWNLDS